MIGSSCGESRLKNADLVSFKNSNKSSSFIFFKRLSALYSFEPDLVLVPSSISCYEDMESLGADNQGSASAVESAEASFLDLDALVLDSDVCFKDCFLLSLLLAPGFLPRGTSSVCEEGFGALESTCISKLQMAFMWEVKGGSSGWFGFSV
ncbi:hypothetical protein Tco_0071141 [Tanacetum coccineum]